MAKFTVWKNGHLSVEVLILSVVGAFVAVYSIKFFLARLFSHIVEISLGIWLTVGIYIYGVVRFSDDRAKLEKLRTRKILGNYKPYAFLNKENWQRELVALSKENPVPKSLFEESFVISESLDTIIEYIIRDFVLSWYRKFSNDTKFPRQLDIAIRQAVEKGAERLYKVDVADFIAEKLLPLITQHYRTFVKAHKNVREKSIQRQLTESRELDMAVALEYKQLHPAVVLKTFDHQDYRKKWLVNRLIFITPLLLNENDGKSAIVKSLTSDIIAGAIIFPVLSMFSDPDFWNQTVMKAAESTLQDQKKVEELRRALDVHSGYGVTGISNNTRRKRKSQNILRLSPNADQATYEKFLKAISKLNSLPEARQTRYYIAVQLKRLDKVGKNTVYCDRLQNAEYLVDQKISDFSGTTTGRSTNLGKDSREDYTLNDILNDTSCSLFFMEFMDRRKRTVLLQFWLIVNSLRDPLTDVLDENVNTVDPLGGLYVGNNQNDESHLDTSNKDDIIQIYENYLRNNQIHAQGEEIDVVKEFIEAAKSDNFTSQQYKNARKALLLIQDQVFERIEHRDLAKFKNSDLFVKFLASTPQVESKGIATNVDNLQVDTIDDVWDFENTTVDDYTNIDTHIGLDDEKEEETNLHAVEEAFIDIMKGPEDVKEHSREKLFESDNEDDELVKETQIEESLKDTSNSYDDKDNDQLHFAAPGDLTLTEAIGVLTEEIEKLYKQEKMIESMLRKAELTNNTSELRILRKSVSSVEREIQRKELQRQQYMVQESDNSLYGRSAIQISSYINGFDSNGQYTLYIIEVIKYTGQTRGISAGWVVARRYSQFYELHQHLREQFAEVKNLDFPKKKLLLKFQHKSLVDARRLALQKYLQELLKLERVCKSKVFRLFLSSETFSLDSLQQKDLESRSSFDEEDSFISQSRRARKNISSLPFSNLTQASSSSQLDLSFSEADFEINEPDNVHPFVQSVCDCFIEIFALNMGNSWIRGRAVIVVLQQLLGGTIEKKLRDAIGSYTSIVRISDWIQKLRDTMWPNGIKRPPGVPRTNVEKSKSKHDSMILLHKLLHDTVSKVVGSSSTRYAARNIFAMYQNEFLNAHLMYSVFDLIVEELFPELQDSYQ